MFAWNSSPKSRLAAFLSILAVLAPSLAIADSFMSTPITAIPTSKSVKPLDGNRDSYFITHPDARINVLTDRNLSDGFYLGVALGSDSYRVKRSTTISGSGVGFAASDTGSTTGYAGRIFAGVGQYFEGYYYLGTEIFIATNGISQNDYATFTDSSNSVPASLKFTASTSAGLSLLPGVKLNKNSLFYLRIGYNKARLKAQESLSVNGTSIARSTKSNWSGGFTFGLGIESALYCHYSLRADYSHTNYSTFSTPSTIKYGTSDNQFNLGLIYHFT